MKLNCIAITQQGLRELKRSKNFYPSIEAAQKFLRPGKEIKIIYIMNEKTLAVQPWIHGYTIE